MISRLAPWAVSAVLAVAGHIALFLFGVADLPRDPGGGEAGTVVSIASLGGSALEPVETVPSLDPGTDGAATSDMPSVTDPVIDTASIAEPVALAADMPVPPETLAPLVPGVTMPSDTTAEEQTVDPVEQQGETVETTTFLYPVPLPPEMPSEVREQRRVAAAAAREAERQRQAQQRQAQHRQAEQNRSAQQAAAAAAERAAANAAAAADATSGAARETYAGRVIAHLRRHQRYPAEARRDGVEGAARLRFTLAASGAVSAASITRGSGHAVLDREVLATVRRASPFPAIPAAVGRSSMSFTVTLRFSD